MTMNIRQEIEQSLLPYYDFYAEDKEKIIDFLKSTPYAWPVLVELGQSGLIAKYFPGRYRLQMFRYTDQVIVMIPVKKMPVKECIDRQDKLAEDFFNSPMDRGRMVVSLHTEYV